MPDDNDINDVEDDFLKFAWFNLAPKAKVRILANKPKTFWLFGAGASHHYDLNAYGVRVPLANGFFKAFNDLPTSQGFHSLVGPFISFLEHYRGVSPQRVSEWDEDIEQFMTSIENELDGMRERLKLDPGNTTNDYMRLLSFAQVFNNMTFILANVVNEAQNGCSMSLYRTLLETCSPGDTFATFNWDTLLDRALIDSGGWSPNTGYGLQFKAVLDGSWRDSMADEQVFASEWKLLKLHGSTNWLVPYTSVHFEKLEYASIVPASEDIFLYWHSALPYATHNNRWLGGYVPTTYCYYPPNIPTQYFVEKQLSAEEGHVFVRTTPRFLMPFEEGNESGVPSSPVLITPLRQKKYENYKSSIQNLWDQAIKSLEDASRIVVIGYSFPLTDERALDLLRAVLVARGDKLTLEIVGPGVKSVASRIGDEYLTKVREVTLHNMTFEEYAELITESVPSLMKRAAEESAEVRDWLLRIYFASKRTEAFDFNLAQPNMDVDGDRS